MPESGNKSEGYKKEDIFFRYFSENQSEVFSYILTLVPHSVDADDIFQEASSVMWRKFEDFQPGTNFALWGCKIAYYIILEHRRKSARNPIRYSSETLNLLAETYSAYQEGKKKRVEQLAECLKNLTDKERLLIRLRYSQAQSAQAIADHFGKSLNMIYKSLAKVHYFLFECIQRNLATEERP